jgi:hypothetical protein
MNSSDEDSLSIPVKFNFSSGGNNPLVPILDFAGIYLAKANTSFCKYKEKKQAVKLTPQEAELKRQVIAIKALLQELEDECDEL